jgi:hypothetical protein
MANDPVTKCPGSSAVTGHVGGRGGLADAGQAVASGAQRRPRPRTSDRRAAQQDTLRVSLNYYNYLMADLKTLV